MFKYILTFGAGGLLGFLVCQKMLESRYRELADEEIREARLALRVLKGSGMTSAEENLGKQDAPLVNLNQCITSEVDLENNTTNCSEEACDLGEVGNYEEYLEDLDVVEGMEYDDGESEEEEEARLAEYIEHRLAPEAVRRRRGEPYRIDYEEFGEEFQTISLYYYSGNGVFVDDGELEMSPDDVVINLGPALDEILESEGTIWIRNERTCRDYEIVRFSGAYMP